MFRDRAEREAFLREHWQKQPLLIRQGLPGFHDPLSPEELAGLACEEAVESRLVFTRGGRASPSWEMRSGPFRESDFTSLPERDWTLLVQAVDHWVPGARELLRQVAFIPAWRIDDLMVSYAAPGGGVGPHFDWYDVFLVQGRGRRRWRIGQTCGSNTAMITTGGQKILQHFEAREEYLLQSGDVLYIPPGVAHFGISEDASMCYSIGFRAPSVEEILIGASDEIAAGLSEDFRYTDPDLRPLQRPGEIPPSTLDKLQALLQEAMRNPRPALARWFGRRMSEARYPDLLDIPEQALDAGDLAALIKAGTALSRHPLARFSFIDEEGELLLFADGEHFELAPSDPACRRLVLALNQATGTDALDLAAFLDSPPCMELLAALYNQGSLTELHDEEEA